MKSCAFIFARGGSKQIPNKNLLKLGDKTLIAHAVSQAKNISAIERVIVSTDSDEIAFEAMSAGAEIPFLRPSELATDESPEWLSWQHALRTLQEIENYTPDIFISLPTTSPLREDIDILNCLSVFNENDCDAVISVTESKRNPYFNMIRNENGIAKIVCTNETKVTRRQDAPRLYDMTTVCYVVKSNFILQNSRLFEGKIRISEVPSIRAIDIDTIDDFEYAKYIYERKFNSQNE